VPSISAACAGVDHGLSTVDSGTSGPERGKVGCTLLSPVFHAFVRTLYSLSDPHVDQKQQLGVLWVV
jgi:hypothetical protein